MYIHRGFLNMTRPRINECHANNEGGALFGHTSEIVITGGSFEDNTAGDSGGMAYLEDQSHLTLTRAVEISGGFALRGAAVYIEDNCVLDMTHAVTLHDNVAEWGGACYAKNSLVTMTDGVILRNNYAKFGGAVYAITSTMIRMARNVSCNANSAESDSGCVHLSGNSHIIASDTVTFADNSAADDGGKKISRPQLFRSH